MKSNNNQKSKNKDNKDNKDNININMKNKSVSIYSSSKLVSSNSDSKPELSIDSEDGSSQSENSSSESSDIFLDNEIDISKINNYTVINKLDKGSESIIYLAYNNEDDKNFYALKIQKKINTVDDEFELLDKLKNKKEFIHIYDYFEYEGYYISIYELCKCNLNHIIINDKKILTVGNIKNIMLTILNGLDILHNKYNVFHGDIKPENIMLRGTSTRIQACIDRFKKDGNSDVNVNLASIQTYSTISIDLEANEKLSFCIIDFGSLSTLDDDFTFPFGTRYYQSPEMILLGKCDYSVDIWAFGCLLFELLTTKILFDPVKDKSIENSRDYNHLVMISNMFGPFNKEFIKKTEDYKIYFNRKHRLKKYFYSKDDTIEIGINDLEIEGLTVTHKEQLLDIINKCLVIEPSERITVKELLQHEFLTT